MTKQELQEQINVLNRDYYEFKFMIKDYLGIIKQETESENQYGWNDVKFVKKPKK